MFYYCFIIRMACHRKKTIACAAAMRDDATHNHLFTEEFGNGGEGPGGAGDDENDEEGVSSQVQDFNEVEDIIADTSGDADDDADKDDPFGMLGRANGDDYSDEEDEDGRGHREEAAQLQRGALDWSATEIMRNTVSKGCLRASTNQNVLFLWYYLMHDRELLLNHAIAC
jgi:hypothetical protein